MPEQGKPVKAEETPGSIYVQPLSAVGFATASPPRRRDSTRRNRTAPQPAGRDKDVVPVETVRQLDARASLCLKVVETDGQGGSCSTCLPLGSVDSSVEFYGASVSGQVCPSPITCNGFIYRAEGLRIYFDPTECRVK